MEKTARLIAGLAVGGVILFITLVIMALTKTGFAIVNDGERGVMKSGTKYDMEELTPGYHFFIPVWQTVDVQTIRPKLINYSTSESNSTDTDLLIFEPVIEGLDNKGIPVKLALSIEIRPVDTQLAEMYKEDGDFDNSFYKKVKQPNREAVQATISRFSVDTIMDKRAEVEKTLVDMITQSYTRNPYFKLETVNLKDIVVPESIRTKQLEVQSAKQDSLKAAELITKAENEAKAREAVAQGEANARLIEANGIAKANDTVSKSLTDNILQMERIKKWNGTVPHFVGSDKSSFIFQTDSK